MLKKALEGNDFSYPAISTIINFPKTLIQALIINSLSNVNKYTSLSFLLYSLIPENYSTIKNIH